jgi:hypothetical protein
MIHPRRTTYKNTGHQLVGQLVPGMCHLSRSHNTFIRMRSPSRLSSWHMRVRNLRAHQQRSTSSRTMTMMSTTSPTMRSTLPCVTRRTRSCITTPMSFGLSGMRFRSLSTDCELCWVSWASPSPSSSGSRVSRV